MTNKRRMHTSSVMAARTSGLSPNKRRKYDEASKVEVLRPAGESRSTQAAARQLGISPKLLYRWQQAQLVAEVTGTKVTHDPEVRALRAANKRLAQEMDILKKALVISDQPARRAVYVSVRQPCQALRMVPAAYYERRYRWQQLVVEPAW